MSDINIGNIAIPVITPQKGVDYWTSQDKQEIINEAVSSVEGIVEPQEQERQANELVRIANEETRVEAESGRDTAEGVRQTNELARQDNEDYRNLSEQTRQGDEITRIENEESRAEAETSRNTSELSRQTAEGIRQTNEQIRQTNETSRESIFSEQMARVEEVIDNIEELEEETSNLKNALPTITGTGTNITLNKTSKNKFRKFEVGGNTEQIQLSGKNLLDKTQIESASASENVTILETGFKIKVNQGYAGKIVIENLKKNTDYYLQYITTNIIGNTKIVRIFANTDTTTTIGQFLNGTGGTFNTGDYTTINIWFYVASNGEGEVDFTNVMLEEGTTATDFEPYCGGIASPNSKFPQQIKNVVGDINNKIENKNLWNNELETAEYNSQGEKITTVVWVVNTQKIKVKPNTTYSISQKERPSQYRIIFFNNNNFLSRIDNTQNVTTGYANYSFTTPTNCNYIYIQFRSTLEVIATGTYDMTPSDITEVQLEEGSSATSYVAHAEQNLPFTLENGQKLMLGGSLQDDGIHNVRGQIVLDGTEEWIKNTPITSTNAYISENAFINRKVRGNVLCSHFALTNTLDGEGLYNGLTLNFLTLQYATLEEWKEYLSEQYTNGTPVIVEYELAEEEITAYNSTQQEQYNAIKEAMSYYEQTNITSTSEEVGPIIDAEAIADMNSLLSGVVE